MLPSLTFFFHLLPLTFSCGALKGGGNAVAAAGSFVVAALGVDLPGCAPAGSGSIGDRHKRPRLSHEDYFDLSAASQGDGPTQCAQGGGNGGLAAASGYVWASPLGAPQAAQGDGGGGCSVGGVGEEGGHERAGDKGGPVETTEGLKTSETASTCGHKRERDGKGSCKGLATVATAVATGRRGGTTWLRSGARPAAAPTALALSPPPPRRRRPRRRRVKWGRCLRSSLLCGPLRESRHCKIVTGVMMSRSARAQECDCVPHSRYSSCGGAPKPCGRRGPRLPCPRPQSDRAPRPTKPAPSMRFARARA